MSPMRETFTLDWDDPNDIEYVKRFLKFHAKRLHCTEHEVVVRMAKELEKGILVEVAKVDILKPRKKKEESEVEKA